MSDTQEYPDTKKWPTAEAADHELLYFLTGSPDCEQFNNNNR